MLLCGELTCIRWGARVRINVQTDCHIMRSRYKSKRRVNHRDIFDAAELHTKCRALNVNSRENFGTAVLQLP